MSHHFPVRIAAAALSAVLGALPAPAWTQAPAAPAPAPLTSAAQPPTAAQIVERLSVKLSLNEEQRTKILPIISERREQLMALRSDTSLGRLRKGRKMKVILEDADHRIDALLDPHQKQQYAQLKEQMHAQAKDAVQRWRAAGD